MKHETRGIRSQFNEIQMADLFTKENNKNDNQILAHAVIPNKQLIAIVITMIEIWLMDSVFGILMIIR